MLRKSGLFDPDTMLKPFVDHRRSSLIFSKTLFYKDSEILNPDESSIWKDPGILSTNFLTPSLNDRTDKMSRSIVTTVHASCPADHSTGDETLASAACAVEAILMTSFIALKQVFSEVERYE